ncbi:hypothetical protein Btru_058263 [Bulinus truncatus]|nr:hypothetical protein Btru_058263 [Bulinus truncatus]
MYKIHTHIYTIGILNYIIRLSTLCLLSATLACGNYSASNDTEENALIDVTDRIKENAELESKEKSNKNTNSETIIQVTGLLKIEDISDKVLANTDHIDLTPINQDDTLDSNDVMGNERILEAWNIVTECNETTGCEEFLKQEDCLVCECHDNGMIAQCSGANLTEIPQDLPPNITHLILSNNLLNDSALYPRVFARYSLLQLLQLETNNISSLPEGVFDGLESLAYLNLFNNTIAMNSNLNSSRVFSPLNKTLHTLVMNRNNQDTSNRDLFYPGFALSVLNNLSHLYLDGLRRRPFNHFFARLKMLTNLTLFGYYPGYCGMESLTSHMFTNVRYLKFLNISDCALNKTHVERDAFRPLTHLETLDLTNNFFLGLEAIGDLMYGLRHSKTLRYLKIQRVVPRFSSCIIVYRHTLRHFKNTSLERIDAMNNEIEMIEYGALSMLPDTLNFINLTNNKIMFGSYWQNMANLVSLKNLHLDGFSHPVAFPETFPKRELHCPRIDSVLDDVRDEENQCSCNHDFCSDSNNGTKFFLPVPPSLKMLTMHSMSMAYIIQNISFCPNNSLEYVDFSGNHFPNLSGPVTGLSHLKVLDLSSCFVETIGEHFFDNLTSLERLNLNRNLLGDSLNDDSDGVTFSKLENLKVLNLSLNNLYRLSFHIFRGTPELEAIDLSANRLSHANFHISHLKRLRYINLTENDLSTLPQNFTDHVSQLIGQGVNVTIDMQKNPIRCDCFNLEFLKWVVQTKTFGSRYSFYYCKARLPDKDAEEKPQGFDDVVSYLGHTCNKPIVLYITVSSVTLIVMLAFFGLALYRFRWTMRYWYHAAKLKISANQQTGASEFKYDVFVSYATKDTDFVLKDLRPKLQERNIKILIHGERFKMARLEAVNTGRSVLVFLFIEEIPTSKMGPEVLSHIKSSTYITYPKLPQHRGAFWDKLADDLRSP